MPRPNPIKTCPGCADPIIRATLTFEQQCSPCRKKERHRLWREANPGANAANAKRWRDAGNQTVRPEGYAEQHRNRARLKYQTDAKHREAVKSRSRQRRVDKPEMVKVGLKAWVNKNYQHVRLYQNAYSRDRRTNDPEYRKNYLEKKAAQRLRQWAKDPQTDTWIRHTENQAIDPTWRAKLHIWQDDHCYICNRHSPKLTIEHIIPRSRGGPTIKQNIVYSCESCNYARSRRMWRTEWMPTEIEPNTDRLLLQYKPISAALVEAELGGELDGTGAFVLQTPHRPDRPLYILSTFMCSERNPAPVAARFADRLQNTYPDAIILFDYEWYGRRSAVINMLRSKMGIANRRPGARQLDLAIVDQNTADAFMRANHVMGAIPTAIRIALVEDSTVYGLGLFADRGDSFECVRLAFNGHVPGGMSRIIKELWRRCDKRPISTFIDTRYAKGDGHEVIDFQVVSRLPESWLWVLPDRVQHRRYLSNDNKRLHNLLYFNSELPTEDNIKANGIFRTWLPSKLKMILKP
jgi:hypothetical protein